MSLEGAESVLRLAGSGARQLAVLLYAVLKDQRRTSGKIRLTNLLRSGKELRVFAVRDRDLRVFCTEAKKYGVLYTVLKDRDAKDGLTDVMVRAEDAGKINRIFERFGLSTVDVGSVSVERELEKTDGARGGPEGGPSQAEKVEAFLDGTAEPDPPGEPGRTGSPTPGPAADPRRSGPFSERSSPRAGGASDAPERRPSVRKELETIRRQQEKTAGSPAHGRTPAHRTGKGRDLRHGEARS